ncbi:MAG: MFS transporter [Deltaproteobacteria bacterium]|nr:MFS transporter [Deltaproteobacteria bacterium]MBW2052479.1 MFS transporter [Deltaproteobacteria bacterium]MBW2141148.1 MFS transporter [Deltaproteobacteria bacterium]MBW2324647.1 MFS transporter [Deltaproteobacteria bacterium]
MIETEKKSGSLSSPKPFYGWVIVGVTFLIGFTEAGVFQNILSIFLKPMAAEFGWSRSLITGAITFGSICGGIASPFVGPALDRHGPRMVAFYGVLILSVGLVALSFLSHPWQLYLFFGIGRMIAVGVLSMVISVSVANWFINKRGRAMGIAHLGTRVGTAIFPPLVQFMILSVGWRLAWGALGLIVFLLSAIPSILFLKRRPEDIGLLPDGEFPEKPWDGDDGPGDGKTDRQINKSLEPEWRREQAVRTPAFWLLIVMSCLALFSGAGINFHIFPFLTDKGISSSSAVLVLTIAAIAGAVGGLILGFLAERVHLKKLLAVIFAALGILLFSLFWFVKGGNAVFVFAVFFGILRGGMMPLLALIWAQFYGRASLGSIFSLASPFRLTANALGPIFGALCFDFLGGYTVPLVVFSILFVLAGLIASFLNPPRYPGLKGS